MNMQTQKSQQGFTLIELMIVVAIIGILASIAVPAYQSYTKKAKFTEVISATAPFKTAVELCANDQAGIAPCTAGAFGVPVNLANPSPFVASVNTAAGVITATATAAGGLTGETYILTPTYTPDVGVSWVKTGTCLAGSPIC